MSSSSSSRSWRILRAPRCSVHSASSSATNSRAKAEAANRLLLGKHRFVHRVVVPLELRLKRTHNVLYELTLAR